MGLGWCESISGSRRRLGWSLPVACLHSADRGAQDGVQQRDVHGAVCHPAARWQTLSDGVATGCSQQACDARHYAETVAGDHFQTRCVRELRVKVVADTHKNTENLNVNDVKTSTGNGVLATNECKANGELVAEHPEIDWRWPYFGPCGEGQRLSRQGVCEEHVGSSWLTKGCWRHCCATRTVSQVKAGRYVCRWWSSQGSRTRRQRERRVPRGE